MKTGMVLIIGIFVCIYSDSISSGSKLGFWDSFALAHTYWNRTDLQKLLDNYPNLTKLNAHGRYGTSEAINSGIAFPRSLTSLDLSGLRIEDNVLIGLPNTLASLKLAFAKITGVTLKYLPRSIRFLDLGFCSYIDDPSFENLRELQLTGINLECSRVGDVGVSYLLGMPLNWLNLNSTNITDVSIGRFRDLPLIWLDVSYTSLTDAAVDSFEGMHLVWLNIKRTSITQEGARRLKKILPPNCAIIHEFF